MVFYIDDYLYTVQAAKWWGRKNHMTPGRSECSNSLESSNSTEPLLQQPETIAPKNSKA